MSPFRKLLPLADRAKAAGKRVFHLNIGQPDIETPAAAIQRVKDTDLKILAYSPAEGQASYREKLVAYYRQFDIELDVDEILVTTGASEALLFVFLCCLDWGEEVIIPEPFYANYNGFAQMAGVNIRPITTHIEDGFSLPDVHAFERHITAHTRAICITNPNNPTGCYYPEKALRELAELVKRHDLFLIVDEVYREFCYDGNEFFSALNIEAIRDQVIMVDSISKRFSACGARIGGIVTRNKGVLESINRYAKLRLSPPGLGQILAEATLELKPDYLQTVKGEYDRRRRLVYERLQAMPGVTSYLPGGAFYCFARFPIDDSEKFCRWLLEDFAYQGATVMVSPGPGFYASTGRGMDEVRLAYVLNTDDLAAAMDCLEQALLVYPGRTMPVKTAAIAADNR